MKIPTVQETPSAFMTRVSALLDQPDTHIYFDTNILIWMSLLAAEARNEFITLLNPFTARTHVPIWAINEFFRVYRDKALEDELKKSAQGLKTAVKQFKESSDICKSQSPISGPSFVDVLDRVRKDIGDLARLAESWVYKIPADETLDWINANACTAGEKFDVLNRLNRLGKARYAHDMPPGFSDDHKKTRKNRGSNQFGDLLLWKEILAHALEVSAKCVVVVTNDRKEDWYFDQGPPAVEANLKHLGVDRWRPVPTPHPLLAYEMSQCCGGSELVLVDQLYLGALAWHRDKKNLGNLVSAALKVSAVTAAKVVVVRPYTVMQANGTLKEKESGDLLRHCFAAPNENTVALLKHLDADAPEADAFIDPTFIENLDLVDLVMLIRAIGDLAIGGHPLAANAATRALKLIPDLTANRGACVHLALSVSTYYNGNILRPKPAFLWLPELAKFVGQPAVKLPLNALQKHLKKNHSSALYILDPIDPPVVVTVSVNALHDQSPIELSMVSFDEQTVLGRNKLAGRQLRELVGSGGIASVDQITRALCNELSVPFEKVTVEDGDELRTIPSDLYVEYPGWVSHLVGLAAMAAAAEGIETFDTGILDDDEGDEEWESCDFEDADVEEVVQGVDPGATHPLPMQDIPGEQP